MFNNAAVILTFVTLRDPTCFYYMLIYVFFAVLGMSRVLVNDGNCGSYLLAVSSVCNNEFPASHAANLVCVTQHSSHQA